MVAVVDGLFCRVVCCTCSRVVFSCNVYYVPPAASHYSTGGVLNNRLNNTTAPLLFSCMFLNPQLPHSYYFTTRILVLKFANKEVFFEEIQDLHFPRKRGYFGTHLREFGEKGVNFDVQCFIAKRGVILSWKVSVLLQKRGSLSNWRTRMGTTFSREWGSQVLTMSLWLRCASKGLQLMVFTYDLR